MPQSKGRGRPRSRVPDDPGRAAMPDASPRWLVPAMLTCFIAGLVWIVAFYMAPQSSVMSVLGNWNLAVGFGLIMVGLGLSTKWR